MGAVINGGGRCGKDFFPAGNTERGRGRGRGAGAKPATPHLRAWGVGLRCDILMVRQLLNSMSALAAVAVFAATGMFATAAETPARTTGPAPAARGVVEAAPAAAQPEAKAAEKPAGTGAAGTTAEEDRTKVLRAAKGKTGVVVIPLREQVDSPLLFILRRGLKEAIEAKADVVVLDMKTPGGAADVTLEIMEALDRFPGRTITFVNDEAGSAGAIVAAITDDIYFSPNGVMGAAELIFGTGQDVPDGLKRKMNSYLGAKIRAFSGDRPRRSDVLEAMMNPDFELKLGEKIIKPKGKLLTLTAREAVATYGQPPEPLLAKGIAESLDDLLTKEFGADGYTVRQLEVTWSERFAVFLRSLAPILLGLGALALYIEFKTPGFGAFGIAGIACLVVVFLSNYVAGLSGHEPMLVFGVGLLLVVAELFFFPGVVVVALSGLALMFGSLVWSMADLWPNEPVRFSGEVFAGPLQELGLGLLVAVALGLALARFIPRGWVFGRLAVGAAVAGSAQVAGAAPAVGAIVSGLVGQKGRATTGLYPSGQVEIAGRRYEARLEVGSAEAGTRVIVRRKTDFGLVVEPVAEETQP